MNDKLTKHDLRLMQRGKTEASIALLEDAIGRVEQFLKECPPRLVRLNALLRSVGIISQTPLHASAQLEDLREVIKAARAWAAFRGTISPPRRKARGTKPQTPESPRAEELNSMCHCCCIRPATHEALTRRVTWKKLCDECLKKDPDPASYVPPDGRALRREQQVADLRAEVERLKAENARLLHTCHLSSGSTVVKCGRCAACLTNELNLRESALNSERLRAERYEKALQRIALSRLVHGGQELCQNIATEALAPQTRRNPLKDLGGGRYAVELPRSEAQGPKAIGICPKCEDFNIYAGETVCGVCSNKEKCAWCKHVEECSGCGADGECTCDEGGTQ